MATSWRAIVATLLGISAYSAAPPSGQQSQPSLGSPSIERARKRYGGQISPPPLSKSRWYLKHVEEAEAAANAGVMEILARMMRAARGDGIIAGVLSTRTDGLVALPKRFLGDAEVTAALEAGHESTRSDFDEMFPPTELGKFVGDYILCGVAIGELVEVVGRSFPVFVRLDPEFLLYRWTENRWYFKSIHGLLPITPGDGRWVLLTAGRQSPWEHGIWKAVGKAFIRKDHASLNNDNWEGKLANSARVAVAPQGASEKQKQSWFAKVMAWGINTVFGLTPGYDVKLLESNGRGYESFNKTIAREDQNAIIAITGQLVTTTGGAGFQNSDIHKSIRADLIKATAEALAFAINTQGIPVYIVSRWGEKALATKRAIVMWDVEPPQDRNAAATVLVNTANAIERLTKTLEPHGLEPDVEAICQQFGVRVRKIERAAAEARAATSANDERRLSLVRQEAA